MKICTKCRMEKENSCFSKDGKNKDGLSCHCKSCRSQWYSENRERAATRFKIYRENHKERLINRCREWRINNPEKVSAQAAAWARKNKSAKAIISSRYRAAKIRATPSWADLEKIRDFYISADALSMLLGEWYEVDHIVPLQGKTVCGLHNQFNLQILHYKENSAKGNRTWPDKP